MDEKEAAERDLVVAEAMSWIGTLYHVHADVKGVGVDCGMLIVRVFCDSGVAPSFDPRPYAPDWHLHRSEEHYLHFMRERAVEVPEPQRGDVMLFRFGRCYSHGGIVVQPRPLTIVHSYMAAGRVVREEVRRNLDLRLPFRKPLFFDYWKKQHERSSGSVRGRVVADSGNA